MSIKLNMQISIYLSVAVKEDTTLCVSLTGACLHTAVASFDSVFRESVFTLVHSWYLLLVSKPSLTADFLGETPRENTLA